jgi:hypothetical protein
MRRLDTPPYGFARHDEERLRALFARAVASPGDDSRAALHAALCDFTRRAKAAGAPAERVVIAVKEITGVELRQGKALSTYASSRPEVQLLEEAVRWCIEEYFGPPRANSLDEPPA